jgi:UrcA family protein
MYLRSALLAAFASGAATLATPCSAEASDIHVTSPSATARVSYADLNLANPAGRARLERRIADAARDLCGSHFALDLNRSELMRACRADAIASARLPALAAGEGGGSMPGNRMSLAAN